MTGAKPKAPTPPKVEGPQNPLHKPGWAHITAAPCFTALKAAAAPPVLAEPDNLEADAMEVDATPSLQERHDSENEKLQTYIRMGADQTVIAAGLGAEYLGE